MKSPSATKKPFLGFILLDFFIKTSLSLIYFTILNNFEGTFLIIDFVGFLTMDIFKHLSNKFNFL